MPLVIDRDILSLLRVISGLRIPLYKEITLIAYKAV
jgi:hypothetical protein